MNRETARKTTLGLAGLGLALSLTGCAIGYSTPVIRSVDGEIFKSEPRPVAAGSSAETDPIVIDTNAEQEQRNQNDRDKTVYNIEKYEETTTEKVGGDINLDEETEKNPAVKIDMSEGQPEPAGEDDPAPEDPFQTPQAQGLTEADLKAVDGLHQEFIKRAETGKWDALCGITAYSNGQSKADCVEFLKSYPIDTSKEFDFEKASYDYQEETGILVALQVNPDGSFDRFRFVRDGSVWKLYFYQLNPDSDAPAMDHPMEKNQ